MDKLLSSSFSAAEKVGSVNHILTEKLLQNPNPDPPSGIFVSFETDRLHAQHKYEFVPYDIENPVNAPFIDLDFDPDVDEDIQLEHSCNGLMLCSAWTNTRDAWMDNCFHKYYIYNPTVNQFTVLPRFETYDDAIRLGMALAFDPSKSPHYKIICVCGFERESCSDHGETDSDVDEIIGIDCWIHIYSSETDTVTPSHSFLLEEGLGNNKHLFRGGVYWNNAVHWLKRSGFLLYFDLEQEIVHEIKTPLAPSDFKEAALWNYIFESRDHLLLTEIHDPTCLKLRIHELKRDYSSWFVKYHIDLEHAGAAFPKIMHRPYVNVSVLSVVLGKNEDGSFLVLEVQGKAVRFNLVAKTFHQLHEFTTEDWCSSDIDEDNVCERRQVYQFRGCLYSF